MARVLSVAFAQDGGGGGMRAIQTGIVSVLVVAGLIAALASCAGTNTTVRLGVTHHHTESEPGSGVPFSTESGQGAAVDAALVIEGRQVAAVELCGTATFSFGETRRQEGKRIVDTTEVPLTLCGSISTLKNK